MRARGLTPSSEVVATYVGPDPNAATLLELASDEWVVTIERVRFADGIALALEKASLPRELSAVLNIDLEKESLHREVARLGHRMARATGYVTARLATDAEAAILGLRCPAALLVENRLILDDTGRPIESTKTAYVGSRWIVDTGSFVAKPAQL
jgi:Transcriptional regulators